MSCLFVKEERGSPEEDFDEGPFPHSVQDQRWHVDQGPRVEAARKQEDAQHGVVKGGSGRGYAGAPQEAKDIAKHGLGGPVQDRRQEAQVLNTSLPSPSRCHACFSKNYHCWLHGDLIVKTEVVVQRIMAR